MTRKERLATRGHEDELQATGAWQRGFAARNSKENYSISVLFVKELLVNGLGSVSWRVVPEGASPNQRGLDRSARRRQGRRERKQRSLVRRVRPEAKASAATSMSIATRDRPRFQEAGHRSAQAFAAAESQALQEE